MIRRPELRLAPAPVRRFSRFVGVALGGGRGKTTAVARLELDREAEGPPRVRLAEARLRVVAVRRPLPWTVILGEPR